VIWLAGVQVTVASSGASLRFADRAEVEVPSARSTLGLGGSRVMETATKSTETVWQTGVVVRLVMQPLMVAVSDVVMEAGAV